MTEWDRMYTDLNGIHIKNGASKVFLIILLLISVLSGIGGCSYERPDIVEIPDVQKLSFSKAGSEVPEITYAEFSREENRTAVYIEYAYYDKYESIEDLSIMDSIKEILQKYDVIKWDGFNKTESDIFDGHSFNIDVVFTDGTEIKAYGNNAFPENYNDVFAELNDLTKAFYIPQCIE